MTYTQLDDFYSWMKEAREDGLQTVKLVDLNNYHAVSILFVLLHRHVGKAQTEVESSQVTKMPRSMQQY